MLNKTIKETPIAFIWENCILQSVLENLKFGTLYRTNNLISLKDKLQEKYKTENMEPRD